MICEYHSRDGIIGINEIELKDCVKIIAAARDSAQKVMCMTGSDHVLYAVKGHLDYGNERLRIFRNLQLTDEELEKYIQRYPVSEIYALHKNTCRLACREIVNKRKHRQIRPITLKVANEFINKHHRHHGGTVGCKFSIALFEGEKMIGVAICGRPVSRRLDHGEICEINRLCTLGGENSCSALYGACSRIAKEMGYKKIITYILESESGISLKASNFSCDGEAGGTHWTGDRDRGQNIPYEKKLRWSRILAG